MVVVSCGAINSAALLLRSANEKHPRGLANSSDIVGRHYMGTSIPSVAFEVSESDAVPEDARSERFYFGSKEWNYPMGHFSFVAKLDGVALSRAHRRSLPAGL